MDKTIIGNNFKRICEERKVSQNELERRTGIAQGTVSKFMKGGDGSIDTMCRLCEGLGISPAELFDDKIFRTEGTRIAHAFLALIENRILFPLDETDTFFHIESPYAPFLLADAKKFKWSRVVEDLAKAVYTSDQSRRELDFKLLENGFNSPKR